MKILVVVPSYFPAIRYGGPIYSVHGLSKAMAELGHDVNVFTTNVDGSKDSSVSLFEPICLNGVKIWYYPSAYSRRLYYSPTMIRALRKHVEAYDLVHIHSIYLWPTWAAAKIARQYNVPYVISPRGMLVKELVKRKNRWLKTVWLRLIEKKNIEYASALHVTSEIEANALVEFGFKLPMILDIPNGIDAPQSYNNDELSEDIKQVLQHSSYVLYFGRINWKKGLDRLVRAWKKTDDLKLVIAGNDDEGYLKILQALSVSEGVGKRIIFLPRSITGADKEALFERANLFVLPSYSENFGNTVLEAMIRSIPVLVSSEVGAADIVRKSNSGLVVDGEPELMAETIRELMRNKEERLKMGEAGKIVAESNYNWSEIGERMENGYKYILEQVK